MDIPSHQFGCPVDSLRGVLEQPYQKTKQEFLLKAIRQARHRFDASSTLLEMSDILSELAADLRQTSKNILEEKKSIENAIIEAEDFNGLFWRDTAKYLEFFFYLVERGDLSMVEIQVLKKLFTAMVLCAENGGISTTYARKIHQTMQKENLMMDDDFFVIRCRNSEPEFSRFLFYSHTTVPLLKTRIDRFNLSGYRLSDKSVNFLDRFLQVEVTDQIAWAHFISFFYSVDASSIEQAVSELEQFATMLKLDLLLLKINDFQKLRKSHSIAMTNLYQLS